MLSIKKICMFLFIYGTVHGMDVMQNINFFNAIQEDPKTANIMLHKNPEYVLLIRHYHMQTALECALVCYQKKLTQYQESLKKTSVYGCFEIWRKSSAEKSHDRDIATTLIDAQLHYNALISSLIEQNIEYCYVNPLKAYKADEILSLVNNYLSGDNKIISYFKSHISKYESTVNFKEKKLNIADDEFFEAFGNGNQKKLITLFDNYPTCFDRINESKNTALHFALRNFISTPDHLLLIQKLVEYNPKNLVAENKLLEDGFDIISSFQPILRKELYDCVRTSLKACSVGRMLKVMFKKAMDDKEYGVVVKMLSANPELISEIDQKVSATIVEYLDNPPHDLSEEQKKIFAQEKKTLRRIRSFVSFCASDLEDMQLCIVRKGRVKQKSVLGYEENISALKDLQKKYNEEDLETIWRKNSKPETIEQDLAI